MAKININQEIKIAEKEKLIAEARKVDIEKSKLEFEFNEAQKEAAKKWWKKDNYLDKIIKGFIGASILTFYIHFAVIPASKIENNILKLENQKAEQRIYEHAQKLSRDSLVLSTKRQEVDSLSSLLDVTITDKRKRDSSYNELSEYYEKNKELFPYGFRTLIDKTTKLDSKYNKSKSRLDKVIGESRKVTIILKNDLGQPIVEAIVGFQKLDKNSEPLSNLSTFTLRNGILTIALPKGPYMISYTAEGHKGSFSRVDVDYSKNNELTFEFSINRRGDH